MASTEQKREANVRHSPWAPKGHIAVDIDLLPGVTAHWVYTSKESACVAENLLAELEGARSSLQKGKGSLPPPELANIRYSWCLAGGHVEMRDAGPNCDMDSAGSKYCIRVPRQRFESLLSEAIALVQALAKEEAECVDGRLDSKTFESEDDSGFAVTAEVDYQGAGGGAGKACAAFSRACRGEAVWSLTFKRDDGARGAASAIVPLPGGTPLATWRRLVAGRGRILWRSTEGHCVGIIATSEGSFVLNTELLGLTAPLKDVAPQLSRALDYMAAAGLWSAEGNSASAKGDSDSWTARFRQCPKSEVGTQPK